MSDFGPPPGSSEAAGSRRRPSYLPPGGLPGTLPRGEPRETSTATAYQRYAVGASHRPGIVALRPLSPSDVLDAATALVRRNPGPVLALSALVNAAAVLPALGLVTAGLTSGWFSRSAAVVDPDIAVALLLVVAPLAAVAVLSGVLGPLTEAAIVGGRPTFGEAWAGVRPRLWALLAAAAVGLAVLVGPWVLAVVAVTLAASGPVPVVVAVATLAVLAASAATLGMLPRVAFAGPAVTFERLGPGSAVRRSLALARGRYWSVLGVGLLAFGVGLVLFVGLQLVVLVVGGLTVEVLGLDGEPAGRLVTAAATLVAATLVTPFLAGSLILQYVDARMRAEGFDLVLRTASARGERLR